MHQKHRMQVQKLMIDSFSESRFRTHSLTDIHVTAILDGYLALFRANLSGSRSQRRYTLINDETFLDSRPSTQSTNVPTKKNDNNTEHTT